MMEKFGIANFCYYKTQRRSSREARVSRKNRVLLRMRAGKIKSLYFLANPRTRRRPRKDKRIPK